MHSDYKDLLRALNEFGVEYLVVGGYAIIEYTEPRCTKGLDISKLVASRPHDKRDARLLSREQRAQRSPREAGEQ